MAPNMISYTNNRAPRRVNRKSRNKHRLSANPFRNPLSRQPNVMLLDGLAAWEDEINIYMTAEHPEMHTHWVPRLTPNDRQIVLTINVCT